MDIVFPGHGARGSAGQLDSVATALPHDGCGTRQGARERTIELTETEKKELEKRMTEYPPNAGLAFLIAMKPT